MHVKVERFEGPLAPLCVAMREERMRETAPYVARCCLLATFNAGLAWLNLRARTESVWPLLIATFSATAAIYATTFPVRELSRWGSMYLWERRVRAWVAQASEELRELEEANGIQGTREP